LTIRTVLIVTDAWHPQINGVVRSLERVTEIMTARGIEVKFLTPLEFATVPFPGYSEIRLSMTTQWTINRKIDEAKPDAIHIATEGPLGYGARHYCMKRKLEFSTSYHTQFPEYLRARLPIPTRWTYPILIRFHRPAKYCLVPTQSVADRLTSMGFRNTVIWDRGVDTALFHPARRVESGPDFPWPRPYFLYVGRVAVEKNIEQFLKLDLPGTKIVVGEGPSRKALTAAYPGVQFVGPKQGEELAKYYASADCFVFPSRTDTFGLVLLESLAAGTPVAAFPVTGPIDVVGRSDVAVLDEDLRAAALSALQIPRDKCRAYAAQFSWAHSTDQFMQYLPEIVRS
jgi:glycosyltransferase involved in cell wall biosynthesis